MGISFDQNISLCFESDTKIVNYEVNFVFFQAKQQKYALSFTISLLELIVSDKNSQIYDQLKFELHVIASRRTNFGEPSEPAPDRGGKLHSAGGGTK